ncbi:DNA replication and repair protein RecF [Acetitomaculum ruminis DSM 5522]|uniref:DNA replication and repair protein RecF n=1 Tax=Acetitomaculum ruminis DSM 5522 TaxID=1120918 RepID=A0A1I0ZDA8_9FIRM|nr:DNA replication/repair protein RecF [Acetitomaculum ruminis]SFB23779.1 DNA replication and repair protein RecF [Acetitomaculum ruminis DSM 5522]
MYIKSLELENFRNYSGLNIEFDKNTNVIYGNNAQGKTNIIEAIYISGTSKSHKTSKDYELIKFENKEAHIRTKVFSRDNEYQIDLHLKKNMKKGIAINKHPIKKASELFNILNFVLFSPEDLNIIKDGPSQRRRFLDILLCQLDKIYLEELQKYNKILNNRNKLLKDIYFNKNLIDTIPIWDKQLVNCGNNIIKKRRNIIEKLNDVCKDIHKKLTGNAEYFFLQYENDVDEKDFLTLLNKNFEKDSKYKMTSAGPHRDDILFVSNGIDIRKFGSQGQQRTTALTLKLAEIEIIKERLGESPILLLDDVLSELDSKRQRYLLEYIYGIQTIITCTGIDDFVSNRFHIDRLFKVNNGIVTTE